MFDSVAPPAYSASLPPFDTLIFDIGDVFFTWKPHSHSLIPPKTLKAVVTSPTWYEFERGKITQALAYEVASKENNIDANDLARSFDLARQTLRFDASLVAFVREMKTVHRLKVYAMSNMSLPDYEYLRVHKKDFGWDIFDDIIISACIGIRKPDLGFYNSVIQCTGVDPARAIFIDDKLDNVLSARSVGMRGIVFQSTQQAMHCIRNAVCDPVARARAFLECNAGCMNSTTNTGVVIRDNFAQMLILEVTGDGSLIDVPDSPKLFNFFNGPSQLTSAYYPCDLDTTSVAWTTVKRTESDNVHHVMDEILKYCNADGITEVYFDHSRPRIDPVVCVNTLSLFYTYKRGQELQNTMDWVFSVLKHRAYLDGTRYYTSPESFLYFFSRLISLSTELYHRFSPILRDRLTERIAAPGDSLALAMRIIACASLGVRDEVDLERLMEMQGPDGGWEDGWFYRYGKTGIMIGNKGVTTAFAMKAILSMRGDVPAVQDRDLQEKLVHCRQA